MIWRRLWPIPGYRWPVAVAMITLTSLVGCAVLRLSGSMPAAVTAHVATIFVVLCVLAARSTMRARRYQKELSGEAESTLPEP